MIIGANSLIGSLPFLCSGMLLYVVGPYSPDYKYKSPLT